jgi:three-Cys-motif partner protein
MNNDEKLLFQIPDVAPKAKEKDFKKRNPIWTDCKAKLIERYLYYFVLITKTGTYIDGFAGPQEDDKHEMWSAKLVLQSTPRWLKNFFLFELDEGQLKHLREMCANQAPRNKEKKEPKRTVHIIAGDFNANIGSMLANNPIGDKEPTFCLLDQRTFECDWASVEAVAKHKKGGNKIELFYFFPEGWINRSIFATKIDKDEKLLRWWGNPNWGDLLKMSGVVRAQYVCERFKSEFGYKHVQPFPIYERKDKGGRVMYYMIHASDHDDAMVLMNRAYEKALEIKETGKQIDLLMHQLGMDFVSIPPLTRA